MAANPGRAARPGRPSSVDRAEMIAVAARIADDDGLEAVTFRAVAAEMGTSAMAVHRASGGIDALRHQVVARTVADAVREFVLPDGGWRAKATAFAHALRELLMRHPLVLEAHRMASLDAPGADAMAHRMVASLREGGLSDEHAAYGYAAVHDFVTGHVAIRLGRGELELLVIAPERREASVFAEFHDYDRRFDFGLRVLLDGLAAAMKEDADAGR
ncbi:TetR/AcrR family transcriptional regulator [Amycolatopsis silviterrae]|uniref:TetR/AcrR family transcriptional regulator n=1 Tax=Amycolatopsis silviterrae TaxID=1656914 RepID=A0ABW5H6E2_9PSEU